MQYRPLGKIGYNVSAIGLGCAPMMGLSLAAGTRLVRRAIELGPELHRHSARLW